MRIDWRLLVIAIGLVLILEGLPWFLFPERAAGMLRRLQAAGPEALRMLGFLALFAGALLLVIGRWML